jgi:GTP-binding protein
VFVDHARIEVASGRGGAGCVSFRREKYVPKGGPDGGDGGRGGDVWVKVDPHVRTLLDCREALRYRADNGGAGSGNNRTGKDGDDVTVWLPLGTVVRDAATGEVLGDLIRKGSELLVARGGRGGRGNARFKSSRNQAPRRADPGEAGVERVLELELKLIADVGFVGLPNAGKSTLLARVSRARPKIADYPFTTLEPNLGIVRLDDERQFVAADIPGLIEGSHEGRGLGIQFLRHIERTRVLALLCDASAPDPDADAALVERELREYSSLLAHKPRVRVLTKIDVLGPAQRAARQAQAGAGREWMISAHTGEGVTDLLEELWRRLEHGAETDDHDDR